MATWKSENGKYVTQGLFYELTYSFPELREKYSVYTMRDEDFIDKNGKKYISFKRLYLEIADPTEYQVAIQLLGGWQHWLALKRSPLLKKYLKELEDELEIKIRSQGVRKVIHDALDQESKSSVISAKWLSDRGWLTKSSKETKIKDKQNEKQLSDKISSEIAEDAARLLN